MSKWQNTSKFKNINTFLDILGIILIVSLIITTFIFWKNAPDTIPTHYNLKGEIDAYGSKNTVFILLPIVVIMFIGLFFLARYPQIYNYVVEITPLNKEKQYNMSTTFMRIINIELVCIFFYIQLKELISLNGSNGNLSLLFLPFQLILLFGSIGYYVRLSIKNK